MQGKEFLYSSIASVATGLHLLVGTLSSDLGKSD